MSVDMTHGRQLNGKYLEYDQPRFCCLLRGALLQDLF
jgi:hypothetical protein